jgi:uncharacterized membrane protein YeaQ/YmgE (transglycosylase-associated protein family)
MDVSRTQPRTCRILPHLILRRNNEQELWRVAADTRQTLEYSCFAALQNHGGRSEVPARQGGEVVVGVESIIIMLVVGAIAGWLAGQIVRGFGFGLIWNIIIGIIGAFIGVWLLKQLGFMPFAGFIGSIVNATIGAVILLVIVGLIRRG